jgi:hypothetical protein
VQSGVKTGGVEEGDEEAMLTGKKKVNNREA